MTEFNFDPLHADEGNAFRVSVGDDQYNYFCVVQYYEYNKKWRIKPPVNRASYKCLENFDCTFDTKEVAAAVAYTVIQTAKEAVEERPLPGDIVDYLNGRARILSEERRSLESRFININIEMHELREFAKKNKIKEVIWRTDDVDGHKVVNDIKKLEVMVKDDGKMVEVPFFSETALYNLIGKDQARSVLALFDRLCKMVAPSLSN